jgi:hypothetical protein
MVPSINLVANRKLIGNNAGCLTIVTSSFIPESIDCQPFPVESEAVLSSMLEF